MAEIERAVGVPAPTLYQWAARGGWRLCDLEGEMLAGNTQALEDDFFLSSGPSGPSGPRLPRDKRAHAAGGYSPCDAFGVGEGDSETYGVSWRGTPDLQGPQGEPLPPQGQAAAWLASARTRRAGGPGGQEKPVPPEVLRASGNAALAAAVKLAASGQHKAARDQLLLGQRFFAAVGSAPGVTADRDEVGGPDPREELAERLERLLPLEMAAYLKAIEEGAEQAYLQGRHVRGSEEWKQDFWWPHLMAARATHPPYGFVDENSEDAPDDPGFMNAVLRLLMSNPNRPEFLMARGEAGEALHPTPSSSQRKLGPSRADGAAGS